ncbi:F-box/FBD/LRR-repeat protein At5g56420-like [Trifolium pratense]|uniref:F-box/FBD/LRR-repeat protein At5g56420-like n=1 Tax=Trifolium pratense TaxID=57577 RepID=UPI001E6944E3|nr:F-box/FBD/LRR-repeat protein At5g56420-like [Trifolium pratense]
MMMHSHVPVRIFCNAEFLRVDEFWDVDIPTFPNLIHMELSLRSNDQWKSVFDILNHCPQLQTFVIENVFWSTDTGSGIWPDTHVVVPECFSSQLRKCVFIDFTGRECEMRFVKFVMQNSTLLRTMAIFSKPDLIHEETHEMLKELASCPRSSAACELLFM